MLVSSFPSHAGGGPMPLAGVPCDLYMQLLACSSSQSVVLIACCLLVILCCVFYSSSNNDCLPDQQQSVCWFSRQEFTTRCKKNGRNSERGLAHRVVTDLVMQLRDKETVVYIDNFFTSIPLLQELKESSINVVGTIGTNRKEYPKALQNKNLLKQMNRGDFHTVACKTTVCTVWKDTKHVSFLSNVHSSHGNCTISRKLRRGENAILPCPPCAVD